MGEVKHGDDDTVAGGSWAMTQGRWRRHGEHGGLDGAENDALT